MDDRQRQIRERAGLEESRLNQEFIEFLRKYSTPALVVAAVGVAGFVGWQKYHKARLEKVDKAFGELATGAALSPDALKQIAQDYEGVRAVPILARLHAADAYLNAVRAGIRTGATPDASGGLKSPEDALTDADRANYLNDADALYARVEQDAAANTAQLGLRLGALFGRAAVEESRANLDAARKHYESIAALTKGTSFADQAIEASRRIELLPKYASLPRLFAKAELAPLPELPKPPEATLPPADAPVDAPAPVAGPELPAPAPDAPAPAPAPAEPPKPQ